MSKLHSILHYAASKHLPTFYSSKTIGKIILVIIAISIPLAMVFIGKAHELRKEEKNILPAHIRAFSTPTLTPLPGR